MDDKHFCELPEPTKDARHTCGTCGAEWRTMYESEYAHDGNPEKLGWFRTANTHLCTLPYNVADFGDGWEMVCGVCGRVWVLTVKDGVLGWTPFEPPASPEVRAEEVTRIMHELGHEEIDPAVIHALMGTAAHAIGGIADIVMASHGTASADTLLRAWNLFAQAAQPYYLTEPCEHHSWEHRDGQTGIQDRRGD